jgi:hypothetical protein
MAQLLIQNKGEAPIEAYTLLGASLSRSEDGLIGQFGSGAKLAITTLLRKGLQVTVYCGLTRMEFKTRTIEIKDSMGSVQQEQVYVQFGGTSTRKQDLGWVLGMGSLDWETDVNMAIREFVANAIDHTVKAGADVREANMDRDLAVEIVPDSLVRAQAGYTRVFIEADEDCHKYVDELNRRFLHFGSLPLGNKIMGKINPDNRKAQIYLNGVWVCELENSTDSLKDYNFTKAEIDIDESRNLNEYTARAAIGRLYRDASVDDLVKVFRALERRVTCLETGLDSCYLSPSYMGATDQQKAHWKEAWEQVHGENTVACSIDNGIVGNFAQKKGFSLGVIQESGWCDAVKEFGVPTVGDVLDANERQGRTLTPPTFEAIDAIQKVWDWITATDLIPDTTKIPKVRGFDEITNAESDCLGFHKPGSDEVYLRNDLGGDLLLETALEEIAHYVTGAGDLTRDIQNFLMRVFIRWMK